MKNVQKQKEMKTDLPSEVQFKLALDYLYRQANLNGWELTANLIGAASDSIGPEFYRVTEGNDLESSRDLFFVPDGLGAKAN